MDNFYPQTLIHKNIYPQPKKTIFPILASAINATIANKADQTLKVLVNKTQELTAAELEAKGYSVEFLYNKDLTTLPSVDAEKATKSGIIDATKDEFKDGFKYSVIVKDAEGNEVKATSFADVKVLADTTATEVTGVKLVKNAADYKLAYVTEGNTGVSFEAAGAKNAFGEELKTGIPAVESVKALNPTVAYYDNSEIVALTAGTAKFEVKFAGIEAVQTVTVEVKAETKATSIKETSLDVVKGTDVELTVLDQYNEAFALTTTDSLTVVVTDSKNNDVADVTLATNNGKLVVNTIGQTADTYKVTVKKGNQVFGTTTVAVVDTAKAIAESYKVVEADKDVKLNLTFSETQVTSKDFAIKGIYKGVDVSIADSIKKLEEENGGGELVITVADEKVATATTSGDTITVTAKGKGETTAKVEFVAGAYKVTLVESFAITVKDETPQYTVSNVALKADTTKIALTSTSDTASVKTEVAAGLVFDGKALEVAAIDASSIKIINEVKDKEGNVTADVVFKTTSKFGGQLFTFAVEVKAAQ